LKGAGARAGRERKQQVESWENEKERGSISVFRFSAFQLFSPAFRFPFSAFVMSAARAQFPFSAFLSRFQLFCASSEITIYMFSNIPYK
jgi:hypothetical protein